MGGFETVGKGSAVMFLFISVATSEINNTKLHKISKKQFHETAEQN